MESSKIQIDFHISSLSADESEKAELTGMLILASDFIKSGKVGRSEQLNRISKVRIPIYLNKVKSGGYIALNPFSKKSMTVPLMRLPSESEIVDFCADPSNLNLNKLYDKINDFTIKNAELIGGYNSKQLKVIEEMLQAPRSNRSDFETLPLTRGAGKLKEDLSKINQLIYDESSLHDATQKRLDIIEKALTEEAKEYQDKLDERTDYWNNEIKNKNEILQREIRERDKQLEKEKTDLETVTARKIKENTKNFLTGVAKNIRSDEKPIEKLIQELEKLTTGTSSDNVHEIDLNLNRLTDATETFRAAVGFAKTQVKKTKHKEEELNAMYNMDARSLEEKCERDKEELKQKSKMKESERNNELKQLKLDRDATSKRISKFRDVRSEWLRDIESSLGSKEAAVLDPNSLRISNPNPLVELFVPMYIFQYKKQNEHFVVAVPPVNLPENMKKPSKGSFFGAYKTVHYDLVVPETLNLISQWFEKESQSLDMSTAISQLPNLLDNPSELRDTFFNSQSLMVDKLKVNKKGIKQANDRLTDIFSSG